MDQQQASPSTSPTSAGAERWSLLGGRPVQKAFRVVRRLSRMFPGGLERLRAGPNRFRTLSNGKVKLPVSNEFLEETVAKLTVSCGHKEYHELQLTWIRDVWEVARKHLPQRPQRCLDLGAFTGLNSLALALIADEVVAVDHQCYLSPDHPKNIRFVQADLDSANWELPPGHYDVCFMIEILEHLLWSPIPLLRWLHANVGMLAITTPDDDEWPAMEAHPWTRYGHYRSIPTVFPGCSGNPRPMFHTKQYKQEEFLQLLSESGFRVVEFSRVGNGQHQMLAICTPR